MEKRIQQMYEDTFLLYQRLVSMTKWAGGELPKHMTDPEYCVDIAFAMSELDKLFHDIGVEIRKVREIAELIGGRAWLQSPSEEPIRTDHCTATVKLKMQPATPPKDSPELAELLDWLGVKQNHNAVRLHWPTLCDIVTKCVEESKPLPACIDPKTLHNPSITMQFHKRKGVAG